MLSSRSEIDDDVCPVHDELLGELCRTNDPIVPNFVSTLAPDVRASLALYCYRRCHLHSMGLAIAAGCNEDDLTYVGGNVGAFLFTSSREIARPAELSPDVNKGKRKITLATGVLRTFAIDDELAVEAGPGRA
jgi:hypothetical protein